MNILLQIAIPLLVASVLLIAIAARRKYIKPEAVVITGVALVLGICALVGGLTTDNTVAVSRMTSADNISYIMAQKYMLLEEYDAASEILEDLNKTCPDDADVQLSSAQLAMLTRNYQKAENLYRNLGMENEANLASQLASNLSAGSDAIIAYLEANGHTASEYGITETKKTDIKASDVRSDILDTIEAGLERYAKELGDEVFELIEKAAELTASFKKYINNENVNLSGAKSKLDDLCEAMKIYIDIKSNPYIRNSMTKGYLMTGNYDAIAENAGEYSTPEEMMILTELYVSDIINKSAFSDEFKAVDGDTVDEMIAHCKNVLEANRSGLSDEQYSRYLERIEQFADSTKDPVLFGFYNRLTANAYSDAYNTRSKSFMSLAKLSYYNNDVDLAEKYVEDALGTASDSNDENYRIPMQQLAGIIQGTSDSEDVKNVAVYVDNALNHSVGQDFSANIIPSSDSGTSDTGSTEGSVAGSFDDHFEEQVVKSTASLNIGIIDKEEFPKVTARVQITSNQWSSAPEIASHLSVTDCGSQITGFSLRKVTYKTSRIVLLCDISGSMDPNEQALKDAIVAFSQNMSKGEEVRVIGFNSNIDFKTPYSSNPSTVAGYADKINTGGGTALYSSLVDTLDEILYDLNSNDIVIAMTDGQDGSKAGEADIYDTLGAKAIDKGVTVYTVGLGNEVDAAYLETIAAAGNGSFLYAEDMDKLNAFYDFIHHQLTNQYELTYTAKNQTLNTRRLKIKLDGEMGAAEKTYYLVDPERVNTDKDSYDPYIVEDGKLTVYGFSSKFLYKSKNDQDIKLVGEGFNQNDDISVTLSGNVEYTLTPTFVDASTYTVTIPASIATGVYDLTVSIRGESVTIDDELTVATHTAQRTYKFGDYHFTALNSAVTENGDTLLSGNVIMNGWLIFKGDVTISGEDKNVEYVTVTDNSGCMISYNNLTSSGLAKYMSEKGVPLTIDKLGSFKIYKDSYTPGNYENFQVDTVTKDTFLNDINILCFFIKNGSFSVYPDMIRFQGINFEYALPFQKQLLLNLNFGGENQFGVDNEVLFGATEIAMMGELKYENIDDDGGLVLVSLPLKLSKFKLVYDTLKNDYEIEGGVGFKALGGVEGFEMSLKWEDGKLDALGFQPEIEGAKIPIITTPIPVTMKDFGFELSGLSKLNGLSDILATTISFKFKVDAASLNDYLPNIKRIISKDDIAVATLKDCNINLSLKEFRLGFTCDFVLATVLNLGKAEIELGKFDYTNALIGYYNETQYGLRAKMTVSPVWDTPNLKIDLNGSVEVTIGYPYTGIWLNGGFNFDIGWWLIHADVSLSGDVMIGVYENSSGNLQFSAILRGTNKNGKYSGYHVYVTKKTGFQVDHY